MSSSVAVLAGEPLSPPPPPLGVPVVSGSTASGAAAAAASAAGLLRRYQTMPIVPPAIRIQAHMGRGPSLRFTFSPALEADVRRRGVQDGARVADDLSRGDAVVRAGQPAGRERRRSLG